MLGALVFLLFFFTLLLDQLLGVRFFAILPFLWILFFQPGFSILNIFLSAQLSRLERAGLAVLVSILFNSSLLFGLQLKFGLPLTELAISSSLFLSSALLFAVEMVVTRPIHRFNYSTFRQSAQQTIKQHLPLWAAGLFFIGLLAINFYLYPFVPEADGYPLILKTRDILFNHHNPFTTGRPLFLFFSSAFSGSTSLDATLLFKYFFPLSFLSILIPPYLLARRLSNSAWPLFLASIFILSFPVVVEELLITRPQSIIIMAVIWVPWLLLRFLETKRYRILLFTLFLSLSLLLVHELSLFVIVPTLVIAFTTYLRRLKAAPQATLWLSLYVLIAAYPYIQPLLKQAKGLWVIAQVVLERLYPLSFHWWFLGHYVNVDGQQLGWPGWQAGLYYAYNLGLVAPFLVAYYLGKRAKTEGKLHLSLPFILIFGEALLFAEILPRFGVTYLPDRAWLYLSLMLTFLLLPLLLSATKKWLLFWSILIALAPTTSWAITYLKQGWESRAGYQAAAWLKEHTPSQSVLITQAGNVPALEVYAERQAYSDGQLFKDPPANLSTYLYPYSQAPNLPASPVNIEVSWQETANRFSLLHEATAAEYSAALASFNRQLTRWQNLSLAASLNKPGKTHMVPVYVLYSKDIFTSLYGQRSWWRDLNNYGFEPLSLVNHKGVTLVYQQNGIYIFQIAE